MTITLPPGLGEALSVIGMPFPDSDEDKLNEMGDAWLALSVTLGKLATEAETSGETVTLANVGRMSTNFTAAWTATDAPPTTLREGAEAAAMIAQGLHTAAKIVVAYKLKVIAELVWLATALATATRLALVTRGASLLAVPFLRLSAKWAIDELTELAIAEVLNG